MDPLFHSVQFPILLAQDLNLAQALLGILPRLQSLLVLNDCSVINRRSCLNSCELPNNTIVAQQKWLIVLLQLMSGNVQPNPGPELQSVLIPTDFKHPSGLSIINRNVRSPLSTMDMVPIWVNSTAKLKC